MHKYLWQYRVYANYISKHGYLWRLNRYKVTKVVTRGEPYKRQEVKNGEMCLVDRSSDGEEGGAQQEDRARRQHFSRPTLVVHGSRELFCGERIALLGCGEVFWWGRIILLFEEKTPVLGKNGLLGRNNCSIVVEQFFWEGAVLFGREILYWGGTALLGKDHSMGKQMFFWRRTVLLGRNCSLGEEILCWRGTVLLGRE